METTWRKVECAYNEINTTKIDFYKTIEHLEKKGIISEQREMKDTFFVNDDFVRKDLIIGENNITLAKKMDDMSLFDPNLLSYIQGFVGPEIFGHGIFKDVCKGRYRGQEVVVIKYNAHMDSERIPKEMRTLNILSHYEYTPKFYGSFQENNSIYLVQEYCNFGTLTDVVNNYPELIAPLEVRLQILYSVLSVIHVLHIYHIPHRKIVPKRILVNKDSKGNLTFKLTGYGQTNQLFTEERYMDLLHIDLWNFGRLVGRLLREDYTDNWNMNEWDFIEYLSNNDKTYPEFKEYIDLCFKNQDKDLFIVCEDLIKKLMDHMSMTDEARKEQLKKKKLHRFRCELFFLKMIINSIKQATWIKDWNKDSKYSRMFRKLEKYLKANNYINHIEDILNPSFDRTELYEHLDSIWISQLVHRLPN